MTDPCATLDTLGAACGRTDDGTGAVTLRVRPYDGWHDVQSLIYNAPGVFFSCPGLVL